MLNIEYLSLCCYFLQSGEVDKIKTLTDKYSKFDMDKLMTCQDPIFQKSCKKSWSLFGKISLWIHFCIFFFLFRLTRVTLFLLVKIEKWLYLMLKSNLRSLCCLKCYDPMKFVIWSNLSKWLDHSVTKTIFVSSKIYEKRYQ